MRRSTLFAILAPVGLCFAVAHAQAPESSGSGSKDERAVRQVMADFQTTWNAHDMKALAELCTEDADFVVVSGKHLHGRDEIYEYHNALHKTALKDRTNQNHIEDIRFIRPDVAIMHVRFEGKSRLPEGDKRGGTLVMDPACRVAGGIFICPEEKR